MQAAIDKYFKSIEASEIPPTVAGMSYFLGFPSRQRMHDYGARAAFTDVVKRAMERIEAYHEQRLCGSANAVGSIFWLKNHANYVDRAELTGAGGGPLETTVTVKYASPKPENSE